MAWRNTAKPCCRMMTFCSCRNSRLPFDRAQGIVRVLDQLDATVLNLLERELNQDFRLGGRVFFRELGVQLPENSSGKVVAFLDGGLELGPIPVQGNQIVVLAAELELDAALSARPFRARPQRCSSAGCEAARDCLSPCLG